MSKWSGLILDILVKRRQFFNEIVQTPLVKKITKLGSKYPVSTHGNVKKANSHVYIDLFEEFEKWNKARPLFFTAIKRGFIGKYETSNTYAERADWFVFKLHKLILAGKYVDSFAGCPSTYWTNPDDAKKVTQARLDIVVSSLLGRSS